MRDPQLLTKLVIGLLAAVQRRRLLLLLERERLPQRAGQKVRVLALANLGDAPRLHAEQLDLRHVGHPQQPRCGHGKLQCPRQLHAGKFVDGAGCVACLARVGLKDVCGGRLPHTLEQLQRFAVQAQAHLVLCARQRHGGACVGHQQWCLCTGCQTLAQRLVGQWGVLLQELGSRIGWQERQHTRQLCPQLAEHLEVRRTAQLQRGHDVVQCLALGQQVFKEMSYQRAGVASRCRRKLRRQDKAAWLLEPFGVVLEEIVSCRMAKPSHGPCIGPPTADIFV